MTRTITPGVNEIVVQAVAHNVNEVDAAQTDDPVRLNTATVSTLSAAPPLRKQVSDIMPQGLLRGSPSAIGRLNVVERFGDSPHGLSVQSRLRAEVGRGSRRWADGRASRPGHENHYSFTPGNLCIGASMVAEDLAKASGLRASWPDWSAPVAAIGNTRAPVDRAVASNNTRHHRVDVRDARSAGRGNSRRGDARWTFRYRWRDCRGRSSGADGSRDWSLRKARGSKLAPVG